MRVPAVRRSLAVTLVALSACGGASSSSATPPTTPAGAPTANATPTATAAPAAPTPPATRHAFPPARRSDDVEVHAGVSTPDPYRWLEAIDSAETRAWVTAENQVTDAYFGKLTGKQALRARLAQLFTRERWYALFHLGKRYFWFHNDGRRDQPTVEMASTPDGAPTTLLDPNQLGNNGKSVFAGLNASYDGSRILYGMAEGAGDWQRWRVRDVATGKDLPDELTDIKYYTPELTRDGTGIYYSRFPTPAAGKELTEADHDHRVYFHRVGTPVTSDVVVYQRPDHPSWQFQPELTRDGKYLVIAIGDGEVGDTSVEQIACLPLDKPGAKPVTLVDTFTAEYIFVGAVGSRIYLQTGQGAPNKKIVAVDMREPGHWRDIIPEGKSPIDGVAFAGKQILVSEMRDAHSAIVAYDLDGHKLRELALPGIGSAYAASAHDDETQTTLGFTSFTVPNSTYRVDLATGALTPWRPTPLPFDPASFETKQVFFTSKDGTRVPMFVTTKKGIALDGSHPTLMTGYGWGGLSMTPYFMAEQIAWLERGGALVLVNIRGGGEYGEAWHLAARSVRRQVQLDDFMAAAERLIADKLTSPSHLGMFGTSGGGTLVASVLVQRPDLFGAVAPIAGVDDLLRFPLFGQGGGWQTEMGHPDDPAELAVLRKLSPVHNARPAAYPAIFVVTSDHDVRVPPLHSYKLAAALQAAQTGDKPVLLRVETDSGHGGGALISQQIDQQTELLAFFAANLGLSIQ